MGKSYHALEAGVPARLRKPLKFLLEAYLLAEREATDPWQYGVEFVDLRRAGMLGHDLRILVRLNYAEHAVEVTGSNEKLRRFRPGSHLGFNKRTCVVFTHLGALWVEQLGLFRRPLLVGKKARRSRKRKPRQLIPYWNKRERVLFLGRHVVKRFRKPAPDQEAILDSEQELGWPLWMDDPLSRKAGHAPKRRLNQTLKNLNRGQNAPRVLFRGDGTGTRLGWSIKWESTPFRHHSERSKVERSLGI